MNSIRRRLSRELLASTLVLLAGGLTALYFAAREAAIEQFDFALRTKALALSTLTFATPAGIRVDFTDRFFHGFEDRRARDFFEMWDDANRPLKRSESLQNRLDLPVEPREFGTPERPVKWNLKLPTGRPGRALGFSFKAKAADPSLRGHEPEVRLVVASDREDLDETLWGLLALAAGCGALLVGATLWVVPRVLRRGLAPLDRLGERAATIDAGSLATRFPSDELPQELQPIASRLNDLLARLESSFERERRFSADLAHELRTPLAELRSLAECALKWPDTRDAATDRETLAIAQHMERLVAHILALTRGEQTAVAGEPLELAPLVQAAWQPFAGRAAERGLVVTLDLQPVGGTADPALLRSILANLFDNAVDYAPRGGTIAVTLTAVRDGRAPRITVANSAPDFDPADLARLFDRFWRKEAARSGGQHFGLGLSLARSFAAAMGWTLTASLEGGQLTFTLRSLTAFPVAIASAETARR